MSDFGYSLSVDGNFGPGTAKAVRSFQQESNLGADGVIRPNAWKALWAG
ncbi:MAG: peptidoglycan-binding domain-containing protein [Acidobacteriota bacterium]